MRRPRPPLHLWLALVGLAPTWGCSHALPVAGSSGAPFDAHWASPEESPMDALAYADVDGYGPVAEATAPPQPSRRGAAAPPPPAAAMPAAPAEVATDAPIRRASIVYTARFVLALYEVEATQRALADAAVEVGGFVSSWQGNQLTVRIPVEQFRAFLTRVEGSGRVIDRNVQASDVSEQFRDVEIRLQNLIAVRARLEALLATANTVGQALEVERELERVTQEIETLRGRLRYLSDQVAYSTLTVVFQALPREQLAAPDAPTPVGIPWLRTLGLGQLLGGR